MPRELILHIGPSTRADVIIGHGLSGARNAIAASDGAIAVPDAAGYDQRWALSRLLDVPGPRAIGDLMAWQELVAAIHASPAERVIVNGSQFARMPREVRRRALADLDPIPMRLIVSLGNLVDSAADAWRGAVLTGSATSWDEWLAGVTGDEASAAALEFTEPYSVRRRLGEWSDHLRERLTSRHLVVVGPSSSDGEVWRRFCDAADLDLAWTPGLAPLPGLAGTQLLARVNAALKARVVDAETRTRAVERALAGRVLPRVAPGDPAPTPQGPAREYLVRESAKLAARMTRADGLTWHGELDEIRAPQEEPSPGMAPPDTADLAVELLAEAVASDDLTAPLLQVPASKPRVSVVVPVYQVRDYVGPCLDSLLAQSEPNLEIIVVDDGSTDGSADVVDAYERDHANVRVIRTPNQGLGAARNVGTRHATGTYLAFFDSDDLALPHAYRMMADTLETTGSAMAVAPFVRLVDGELATKSSRWMPRVHGRTRLGVNVADFPVMVRNVFAWTKLFRRSFWDANELAWPEGVRYEDQPCTIRAFLRAPAVDVLASPIAHYRTRSDKSSITQTRDTVEDLKDRWATKKMATDTVLAEAPESVRKLWFSEALPGDAGAYAYRVPDVDDAWWEEYRRGLLDVWPENERLSTAPIAAPVRLIVWLAENDRRDDAVAVAEFMREREFLAGHIRIDGAVHADLPLLDDDTVPRHLFRPR